MSDLDVGPGWVVILNGTPRSGKTSIARSLDTVDGRAWVNHGVDAVMAATPEHLLPGIGLRPGGERPDLEPELLPMFAAMYAEVARLARDGMNVAVDVGHHDDYSTSLGILDRVGDWLGDLPTLWVGVRCDIDEIMRRRDESGGAYLGSTDDGSIPAPVLRWQDAVHEPGDYDLEVDTTDASADDCAGVIVARLAKTADGNRQLTPPDQPRARP